MYKKENNFYATFEGMWLDKERIFFSEWSNNEIYQYNWKSKELKFICQIDEEIEDRKRLFADLRVYNDKLYLSAFAADSIYEVDVRTGDHRVLYNFKRNYEKNRTYLPDAKMMDIHIWNNNLYFMPASFPGILKINIDNKQIKIIDNWVEPVRNRFGTEDAAYTRGTMLYNHYIFMPLCNGNGVLILDLLNDEYEIKEISGIHNGFSDICFDGHIFWLSSRFHDTVTMWNMETNSAKAIKNDLFNNISRIEFFEGNIYLLPQKKGTIVKINASDCQGESIKKVDEDAVIFSSKCNKEHIAWLDFNKGVFSVNEHREAIRHINKMDSKHNKFYSKLFHTIKENERVLSNTIYYEDYSDALKDFVENI